MAGLARARAIEAGARADGFGRPSHYAALVKLAQHRRALDLLEQHPGWSDRYVARILHVSPSTVSRWRWRAGLAPATKSVQGRRRRVTLI